MKATFVQDEDGTIWLFYIDPTAITKQDQNQNLPFWIKAPSAVASET
jgi:hypothetical protein